MTVRKFIVFSLLFHVVLFAGFYFFQLRTSQKEQKKEYTAMLVTPEEPAKVTQPPVPRGPAPLRRAPRPHARPMPQPSVAPPSRPLPPIPKAEPVPGRPVLPGEGLGGGKEKPDTRGPSQEEATAKRRRGGKPEEPADMDKPGFTDKKRFFFDREITDEIASRETNKRRGPKGNTKEKPITFDTKVYEYAGYMSKLRYKIESIWEFPREALARGIKFPQDLKIQFTIKKDGSLGEVKLIRTSGYKLLDDAAMKALKDGEPYWPLPEEWGKESHTVLGHFIYNAYGYELK